MLSRILTAALKLPLLLFLFYASLVHRQPLILAASFVYLCWLACVVRVGRARRFVILGFVLTVLGWWANLRAFAFLRNDEASHFFVEGEYWITLERGAEYTCLFLTMAGIALMVSMDLRRPRTLRKESNPPVPQEESEVWPPPPRQF